MRDSHNPNYAFIDAQNLHMGIASQGWEIDYRRFKIFLHDKFLVSKVFLFIGYVKKNESLYRRFKHYGYILVFKEVVISRNNGVATIKGNVDAELVLHTMIEYANFNKAVIVSGDGDFKCLIEYLDKFGKLGKVLIPHKHKFSALLRPYRTNLYFLADAKNKIERH
jgi:uncharacterized LabA/DUF88 family protein